MIEIEPVEWVFYDALSISVLAVERKTTITINRAAGEPWAEALA